MNNPLHFRDEPHVPVLIARPFQPGVNSIKARLADEDADTAVHDYDTRPMPARPLRVRIRRVATFLEWCDRPSLVQRLRNACAAFMHELRNQT